jgi:hypothetical protein
MQNWTPIDSDTKEGTCVTLFMTLEEVVERYRG